MWFASLSVVFVLVAVLAFQIIAVTQASAITPSRSTTRSVSTSDVTTPPTDPGLLTLSLLSNGKPQSLSAPSGDAFYTLYVPPGTTPVEFVATILVRGPVTGGIATITTPASVYPENLTTVKGTSSISAPLTASDVQNGVVSIHVHVDLNLDPNFLNPNGCTTTNSVVAQIQSAVGELSGAVTSPTTPADFWPPSLSRVTVWVPPLDTLSPAEAKNAALASMQVAATVAQQYGPNTTVSFAEGAPPSQLISPITRNVAIEITNTGPSSQIRVDTAGTAPVLVIAGQGSGLVSAAKSIGVRQLELATAAQVANVTSGQPPANPSQVTVLKNGTREITLAQLGTPTTIEGLGTVDVTQSLSQAQFGVPISSLQLRLQADYTPPPPGGVATFSALVGGYIVASQRLGTSGTLAMDGNVPTSVLSRAQTVDFRLDYSPPGGFCHAGLVPVQVTLNPASGFAAQPGQTLPPGFARSPQDVAPGINVDLVSVNDSTLIDGCKLLASLAQILPSMPTVSLVPTNTVATGHTTEVVVGATSAIANELHAPLQLEPFRTVSGSGVTVGYSVNQPFAALESFSQNGRDVILVGAYARPALTGLLTATLESSLSGGGWFSLGSGQLAVMTSDGRLRLIGSGALLPQLATVNPANNLGISTWFIIGVGAVVAAVVLRLGWLALKMSRLRRKARAAKKAETTEKKPDESTDSDPTTWF